MKKDEHLKFISKAMWEKVLADGEIIRLREENERLKRENILLKFETFWSVERDAVTLCFNLLTEWQDTTKEDWVNFLAKYIHTQEINEALPFCD